MNFLEKERKAYESKKIKRRHKFFTAKRPYRSGIPAKIRCGIRGCRNEAVSLRGQIPNCGQHK
jgi:hypothetical protein